MIAIMQQGGSVMLAIFAISAFAWTLAFWQWLGLRQQPLRPPPWADDVLRACQSGRLADALIICELRSGLLAQAMHDAIAAALRSPQTWRRSLNTTLRAEGDALGRQLPLLAALASSLPLLGLLGTVLGMIASFAAMRVAPGSVDALSSGISQALLSTQGGLVAALPVLLLHRWLSSRVRRTRDTATLLCHRLDGVLAEVA
jgi:biopolymer transport protein ExbB